MEFYQFQIFTRYSSYAAKDISNDVSISTFKKLPVIQKKLRHSLTDSRFYLLRSQHSVATVLRTVVRNTPEKGYVSGLKPESQTS